MSIRNLGNTLLCIALASFTGNSVGHGLIEKPASRNWYCGVITKPHEVTNGVAEHPECGDAFASDFNSGYQFMSVLTHTRGRAQVRPLPAHVCGFDSETWNGGATPWDQVADWPTNPMRAGRQEFLWNIQWGPHFDDTEEFRYWITKPGFQYQRNRALTWNDFESTEFCLLRYDDSSPNQNPNVIPLKDSAQFRTFCDVPERQGRHIIYAEWGRNQWTYERFHGCIDVVFDDSNPPPADVVADINLDISTFVGDGSLTLDGSSSQGDNLSYTWSVSAPDNSIYSIADPNLATTTLRLDNPSAAQTVTVSLRVSNSSDSSTATTSFLHEPDAVSMWVDLGQLTTTAQTYQAGDKVSVRTVSGNGQDNFYPTPPLELNANNTAANAWPLALAQAVNAIGADITIGVLGSGDQVTPIADATDNRVYAVKDSDIVSAFLQVERATPPTGECTVNENFENGGAGWVASNSSTCATGHFVVGKPTRRGLRINGRWLNTQAAGESGNAWFTAFNTSRGNDDVDDGTCILESRVWRVDEDSNLSLSYFHGQKDSYDDDGDFFSLDVSIDGGATFAPLVSIGDIRTNASWTEATMPIPAGSNVAISVRVADGASNKDLVEAGIDDVKICRSR